MARRNILDYKGVLSFLETTNRIGADRVVQLKDVLEAFVIVTDKSKSETIQRHIDYMCGMRVLQRKGDMQYRVTENWKAILDEMV